MVSWARPIFRCHFSFRGCVYKKPHIIFFVWSHSIKIPPIRNRITKITGDHLYTKARPWSEPCSKKLPLRITLIWFDLLKSFPTPPKKTRCVQHLRLALLFWLSSIPKHSMYGIVTIYFPTWMVNFYGACRKTYHTLSVWDNVLEKRPPSCIFASDHASQV